jgi:CRP-like cAMP-binding protein
MVTPSEEEWEAFYKSFRPKSIRKNEVYLAAHQTSKYIAFIEKGCFRMFYTLQGEERCKDFQTEGQFTGSLYSFLSQKPALYSVAAVEDSDILEVSRDKLYSLYKAYHVWERFGRMYIEQIFLYKEQREASLLNKSAKERYDELVASQPALVQRLPLKYISSYLGIQPESLSRLRKIG